MKSTSFVSNVVLCVSSGYCLSGTRIDPFTLPTLSYGLIFMNACCGIICDVLDSEEDGLPAVQTFTKTSYCIFSYPCIVGQLWLNNNQKELGYFHPAIALVPFCLYIQNKSYEDMLNMIILGETVTCCYLGIIKENQWAIVCGLMYAYNLIGKLECFDLPPEQLFCYTTAVCVILSFLSLGGTINV